MWVDHIYFPSMHPLIYLLIYMFINLSIFLSCLHQFTEVLQNTFRMITAEAINTYCEENPDDCDIIPNDESQTLRKRNIDEILQQLYKKYDFKSACIYIAI